MSTATLPTAVTIVSPNGAAPVATASSPLLQTVWNKIRSSAAQIAQVVIRFVNWVKGGLVTLAGSPLTIGSLMAHAVMATEKGYHGILNVLESALGYLGKAIDWALSLIGKGLSFITDAVSWLLHKVSSKVGDWFDGAIMAVRVGYAVVSETVATFVTAGFNYLHLDLPMKMARVVAVITGGGVLANVLSGGWLATQTSGTFFGVGMFNLFHPVGALLVLAAVVLGGFIGGGIADFSLTSKLGTPGTRPVGTTAA